MKSITQQCNEQQSSLIEVICRASILESTRRHSHLQLGHMCITAVEHHADEARLAVGGESGKVTNPERSGQHTKCYPHHPIA
jgi:hypothetical protein